MYLTAEQRALLRSATILYSSENYTGVRHASEFQNFYLRRPVLGVPHDVKIHKYRRDTNSSETLPDTSHDGRILDHLADGEWLQAQRALRAWKHDIRPRDTSERDLIDGVWTWRGQGRLTNAFKGKGYPKDIAFLLTVLIVIGHLSASQREVQSYCDTYIGMDCSGFVNNYFIARGRGGDNASSRNRTISTLAASSRQLAEIPRDPTDHIVSWTVPLHPHRPGSHIAVINGWESRRPDRLSVSEPGASVGGLRTTVYRCVSGPDSHGIWRFYSEARKKEQRLLLALPLGAQRADPDTSRGGGGSSSSAPGHRSLS
jgi:hypothetical protein